MCVIDASICWAASDAGTPFTIYDLSAPEKQLLISFKLSKLSFDPEIMRRVVVNLVNNALQAVNKRKEEKDKAFRPIVRVSSKRTDGGALIIVADNGIDMDEENAKRAFEPLFTTKARGTGLGLANVRKIIDEHDGWCL